MGRGHRRAVAWWIASTDADSVVPAHWLLAQWRLAADGRHARGRHRQPATRRPPARRARGGTPGTRPPTGTSTCTGPTSASRWTPTARWAASAPAGPRGRRAGRVGAARRAVAVATGASTRHLGTPGRAGAGRLRGLPRRTSAAWDPADRPPPDRPSRLSPIAMATSNPDARARRLLLVVDAPSLLHRNHHARAHTGLRDRQGRPIWALHGMLRQILESIDTFAPDAVVFGLDDRTGSVRRDAYPDYKAGRAQKDPELVDQLDRAGALLDALGLATVTPAGPGGRRRQRLGRRLGRAQRLELRDHHLRPRRLRPHQRTTRRCCGSSTAASTARRCSTRRACSTCTASGPPTTSPSRRCAATRSDNLPGVQGIGEKTAAILLDVAGSMDAAWADIDHNGGRALLRRARRLGRPRPVGVASAPPSYAASRRRGARERYEFNVRMMSGPRRPRPRPDPRRARLARPAAARPRPGDPGGRLPRQRLHHRLRGAGADLAPGVGLSSAFPPNRACRPQVPGATLLA